MNQPPPYHPPSGVIPLPEIIAKCLVRFERQRKSVLCLRGLAETLVVLDLGLVLVMLLEWVLRPPLAGRLWLSGLSFVAAAMWLVYRAVGPLLKRSRLIQTARDFESAAGGHFQERILSAVEWAAPGRSPPAGVSGWMIERTVSLAAQDMRAVDPDRLVDRLPARKAWNRAALVCAGLALVCLWPGVPARLRLAANPYAVTESLSPVRFTVTPGNCRVRQGTPVEIRVNADTMLESVKAAISWEDGLQESVLLSPSRSNEYVLALPSVAQGFRYSVRAAEARSAVYAVQVDVPPRIAALKLSLEPPAYTYGSNRVVEGGSAQFLAGTRVRLLLRTAGTALAAAEWLPEGYSALKFKSAKDQWTLDLLPTNAFTYQIHLVGANKLTSDSVQKWSLRPVPDEPPTARLTVPGTDAGMVQRDETLLLRAQANDDVGLDRVDLVVLERDVAANVRAVYPANAGELRRGTLPRREVQTAIAYPLADLGALTGDEIQLLLVARDLRQQVIRSEPVSLTLGSLDKVIEAGLAERLKDMLSSLDAQAEYLRQTRSSWLAIARNYQPDNPETRMPATVLLESRLDAFGREVGRIGERLAGESETNQLAEARFLHRFGVSLAAWAEQQREVLKENCGRLNADTAAGATAVFNQGRELFGLALTDLERHRRVLAILQGAFATDVLATRCVGAQGRYKRGLPLLRGEGNVIAPITATGSGLLATFFEETRLSGRTLDQKVDYPRFDNYAAANRREQWSCRYEGDIHLTESGEWTFACVADDGVRLVIAGKPVLPVSAWGPHPATQYQGDLRLDSGWHPLVLEYFQGSGESKLRFLMAKKGGALQEVPPDQLRPPSARRPEAPAPTQDPALAAVVKDALNDRVRNSLRTPASVPAALVPLTNVVQNESLTRAVRDRLPVSEVLSNSLDRFVLWKAEDSRKAESQADELTGLSQEAQRILRAELDKFLWQYEGTAALKGMQTAIRELREINQQLRQLPHNPKPQRTEAEQARIDLAKAWEKQLEHAAAEAARDFFEVAKRQDATLAERALALTAAAKAEQDLPPVMARLAAKLDEKLSRDELAGQIEGRLGEISDRYRELNELREKINREQVAAEARRAWQPARGFARAQQSGDAAAAARAYPPMQAAVQAVARAQRVAGDYQGAARLSEWAGESPAAANGKEVAREVRELAQRTDPHPPSLAQTIPPPMSQQAEALAQRQAAPAQAADRLAAPRLAMMLEAARLRGEGNPSTAMAYDALGEDTGALLAAPERLDASTLKPLAERAAALAGQKGELARQAEIQAAGERFKPSDQASTTPAGLAARLEELSTFARRAADDNAKREPLTARLDETARLTAPATDWAEAAEPRAIAGGAAQEALAGIQAAPKEWGSYNEASQILAEAARQVRTESARSQLAALNPYRQREVADRGTSSAAVPGPAAAASALPVVQSVPKGKDQAEWARLNGRLRDAIRSSGIETFSAEQQTAIRAYFERLSADPATPDQR